jgi:aldose 1-epimerase
MIESKVIGQIDNRDVKAFVLSNSGGMKARIIEFGATLTEFHAPDRQGRFADVVLGHDSLEGYVKTDTYFGAICGRYGNRIARGRFGLDGREYQTTCNEGRNQVHGGKIGFDKKLWEGKPAADGRAVVMTYRSPDGEEGFPGNLDLQVDFMLDDDGRFVIDIAAETDKPTLCNPVHHSYWNLAGHTAGDVLEQELEILADFYTPVDAELIATGEILSVRGTPYDFTAAKPIGRDLRAIDNQGGGRSHDDAGGYDHNWVLRGFPGEVKRSVRAVDPASGRGFELSTSEPGVQFYTGGYLNKSVIGKGGHPYCRYAGFTLETQRFPDSPNIGHFPQARLDPGRTYRHRMEFQFFRAD